MRRTVHARRDEFPVNMGLWALAIGLMLCGPAAGDQFTTSVIGGPGDQTALDAALDLLPQGDAIDGTTAVLYREDGALFQLQIERDADDSDNSALETQTIELHNAGDDSLISASAADLATHVRINEDDFGFRVGTLAVRQFGGATKEVSLDRPGATTFDAVAQRLSLGPDRLSAVYNVASLELDFNKSEFVVLERIYDVLFNGSGTTPTVTLADTEDLARFSASALVPGELHKEVSPDGGRTVVGWSRREASGGDWETFTSTVEFDAVTGQLSVPADPVTLPDTRALDMAAGRNSVAVASIDPADEAPTVRLGFASANFEPSIDFGDLPSTYRMNIQGTGTVVDVTFGPNTGTGRDAFLVTATQQTQRGTDAQPSVSGTPDAAVAQQINAFARPISPFIKLFDDGIHNLNAIDVAGDPQSGLFTFAGNSDRNLSDNTFTSGDDTVFTNFQLGNPVIAEHANDPELIVWSDNVPSPLTDPMAAFDGASFTSNDPDASIQPAPMPNDPTNLGWQITSTGNATFEFRIPRLTDEELELVDPAQDTIKIAFDVAMDEQAVAQDAKFKVEIFGQQPGGLETITVTASELDDILNQQTTVRTAETAARALLDPAISDTLEFVDISWTLDVEGDPAIWIDNFSIWVEPIPEPTTALMLFAAAPVCLCRRRRRCDAGAASGGRGRVRGLKRCQG